MLLFSGSFDPETKSKILREFHHSINGYFGIVLSVKFNLEPGLHIGRGFRRNNKYIIPEF